MAKKQIKVTRNRKLMVKLLYECGMDLGDLANMTDVEVYEAWKFTRELQK
jgi:hypothetical protein